MQPQKHLPGIRVLEGARRKTVIDLVQAFFGTVYGTWIGLGIVLALYALVGTQEYNALIGR